MGWQFYDSSGRKLNTASTLIDNLDIDGATDIGAAIVDADLFIVDDGAGGTNRKTAASRVKTYIAAPSQAVQSAIEAETNQDTYVPPDLMKHHPGVAKAWCNWNGIGTQAINQSYNISGIADIGTGGTRLTFTVNMSADDFALLLGSGSGGIRHYIDNTGDGTILAATVDVQGSIADGSNTDGNALTMVMFGDQ
jgi:hypothetical protein